MPALPGDFELSDRQAGNILEKVALSEGVSYDQLRGVSGMLSYLYAIKSGESGSNWPEVKSVLEGFTPSDFEKSKTLVPESYAAPEALTEFDFKEFRELCER